MAAVESKTDGALCEKTEDSPGILQNEIDYYDFEAIDVILCVFSVVTLLADIVTDGVLVVDYLSNEYTGWACLTLILMVVPAGIIQLFSLRWHHIDGSLSTRHWISHFLLMGIVHRYLTLLQAAVQFLKNGQPRKKKEWVHRQQSDICMLHLFQSFMEAAPQLLLQFYVMVVLQRAPFWTSVSAAASLCSLAWAIAAYTRAMRRARPDKCEAAWPGLTLQAFWRGGMLASRIAALVLAAVCAREWIFLLLGVHWLGMTTWVIFQNTDFCPTLWEERIYNCIIGVIYCFDFFNLCEGQSRYRALAFYLITVSQNILLLAVQFFYFKAAINSDVSTISLIVTVGGTTIGLTSMLIYYGKFHPGGSKQFCHCFTPDSETASEKTIDKTATLRSLKHRWHDSVVSLPNSIDQSQGTILPEDVTADKKSLLVNIVQNSEFLEEGLVNQICEISDEIETVVQAIVEQHAKTTEASSTSSQIVQNVGFNSQHTTTHVPNSACQNTAPAVFFQGLHEAVLLETAQTEVNEEEENESKRQKRRGICSPIELGLDSHDSRSDDLNASLQTQKRRGICSSAQLGLELVTDEDNYVEKNFRGAALYTDVSKLGPGGNAALVDSDDSVKETLEICDNIKDRERLNTPVTSESDKMSSSDKLCEENSQKEETMSQVTSVHDYENVCPLGIARPPWCIRSWKGYTDIETYIHDDSVVRDRRRDTLTSSATGTTFSSEFSDPIFPLPTRKALKRSRQDDYMETLVYDLVDWDSNRTVSNEETSTSTSSDIDEQDANLFMAKPVVIDDKGGMFALDTILEEREDSVTSSDTGIDLRRVNNYSVSTLVATIDEIRKCTVENSPRHVYHKTESQWEDMEPRVLIKKSQLAKVLFSNGFSQNCTHTEVSSVYDISNEILAIREMAKCHSTGSTRKTPLINAILSDSPILGPKAKIQKYNSMAEELNISGLEHNVYVEMRPLVPEKSDEVRRLILSAELPSSSQSDAYFGLEKFQNSRFQQSSAYSPVENQKEADLVFPRSSNSHMNDESYFNLSDLSPGSFQPKLTIAKLKSLSQATNATVCGSPGSHVSYEKRRRTGNRPRRKFSLLRERFEPKSEQLIYTVTPKTKMAESSRTSRSKMSPDDERLSIIANDKENLTPAVTSRISHWNTFIQEHNSENDDVENCKEKRSIFFERVSSPPKFHCWTKRKTFSPNATIVHKALQN